MKSFKEYYIKEVSKDKNKRKTKNKENDIQTNLDIKDMEKRPSKHYEKSKESLDKNKAKNVIKSIYNNEKSNLSKKEVLETLAKIKNIYDVSNSEFDNATKAEKFLQDLGIEELTDDDEIIDKAENSYSLLSKKKKPSSKKDEKPSKKDDDEDEIDAGKEDDDEDEVDAGKKDDDEDEIDAGKEDDDEDEVDAEVIKGKDDRSETQKKASKMSKREREASSVDKNKFPPPGDLLDKAKKIQNGFESKIKKTDNYKKYQKAGANRIEKFNKKADGIIKKLSSLVKKYNKYPTRNNMIDYSTDAKKLLNTLQHEASQSIEIFQAKGTGKASQIAQRTKNVGKGISKTAKNVKDSKAAHTTASALKKAGQVGKEVSRKAGQAGKEGARKAAQAGKEGAKKLSQFSKESIDKIKESNQAKLVKKHNPDKYNDYIRAVLDFKQNPKNNQAKAEAEKIFQTVKNESLSSKAKNVAKGFAGSAKEKATLASHQKEYKYIENYLGKEKAKDYIKKLSSGKDDEAKKILSSAKGQQSKTKKNNQKIKSASHPTMKKQDDTKQA